jgi:integrase
MSTKQSFSILVWLLKYRQKNGKAPLSIRITVNGERAEILTNREVAPTLWDSKAQRVKGISEEAKAINAHLETINKLLPVRSNQRVNGYLKEIAAICGINKDLTTHSARHTFATTTS